MENDNGDQGICEDPGGFGQRRSRGHRTERDPVVEPASPAFRGGGWRDPTGCFG